MRRRRWMIWLMLIVVLAAIGIGLYLRDQERTIELQPTVQPASTPAPTAAEEPAVTYCVLLGRRKTTNHTM